MPSNVADYIAYRLKEQNVDVLFGVPGVTCAEMFEAAARHDIRTIINSSDLDAGYAADGYARIRGLGAVSVSYGTGTLSLVNALAGAYAERSPVVLLNGGPSLSNVWNQNRKGVLFSHSIGKKQTDLNVFQHVTEFAVDVENAVDAPFLVDHALKMAITRKRPIYIEVPKLVWYDPCSLPTAPLDLTLPPVQITDQNSQLLCQHLNGGDNPVILLGEEIQRYGLADLATSVVSRLGIPWATTPLGKSVISEQLPGFIGVYDGVRAREDVRCMVQNAAPLIALGCMFGIGHTTLVHRTYERMIHAYDGLIRLGNNVPFASDLSTFLSWLESVDCISHTRSSSATGTIPNSYQDRRASLALAPVEDGLSHEEVFTCVDQHLDEEWIVVADTFLGTAPAVDLNISGKNGFQCNTGWASIGHSVGASVGIALASTRRPLVICGDGGFQMTVQSLSSMAQHDLGVVILLIDNGMYGIEQRLIMQSFFEDEEEAPLPYVVLNRWDYQKVAQSMGVENTLKVETPAELSDALTQAKRWQGPGLIQAVVKSRDLPPEWKASYNTSCP